MSAKLGQLFQGEEKHELTGEKRFLFHGFMCHGEKSREKVMLCYVLSGELEPGARWCGIVGDDSIRFGVLRSPLREGKI